MTPNKCFFDIGLSSGVAFPKLPLETHLCGRRTRERRQQMPRPHFDEGHSVGVVVADLRLRCTKVECQTGSAMKSALPASIPKLIPLR